MILVDTTVLVYAVGSEHLLREPCRALIGAIGAGAIGATTTIEAIQEFTHVRARRRGRADAVQLAAEYANLLSPLVSLERADLDDGLLLYQLHEQLGSFDAVLAAAALRRDHVTALASADRAFGHVGSLDHRDPAAPDFLARLGL